MGGSLIGFLGAFVVITVAVLGGWAAFSAWRERQRQLLQRRIAAEPGDEPLKLQPKVPDGEGWADRLDRAFNRMVERTGLDLDSGAAVAIIVLLGVVLGAVVFVWKQDEDPWLALPAFAVGSGAPLLFFWIRQRIWRRTLNNQLPDAFFLLARSMRAGRSLEQAFRLVAEQGVPPLSKEFARMHRQMDLGLPLGQVLETAAARLDILDFNIFAAVVALQRPTGGNLPATLDRLAVTTRDRIQFEGQYRAATAMGRYSAGFIFAMSMLILGYLFFFDRETAMKFFDSATGVSMFLAALALEAAGGVLLFALLRYEY
jgi:tight adherence protein B